MRRFVRTAFAGMLRAGLAVLMSVHRRPARRALVYGRPDTEENSLVAALALTERYPGEVWLLCQDERAARRHLEIAAAALGGRPDVVRVARRRFPGSLWTYVHSELVLYTLPIYVAPRARGPRVHVNLWHGTGPKRSSSANFEVRVGASAITANCASWGRATARQLHMPQDAEVLVGNLRQDLLPVGRARDGILRRLRLDPDRPLVLWMPTYRSSVVTGVGAMQDADPLSVSAPKALVTPRLLAEQAALHGVQVVVKPHPLDSDDFRRLGIRVLTDQEISDCGAGLSQFLGMADGLISDYSSAWTDFLQTKRSIALFCPDLDAYTAERGLSEPLLGDVAAGLFIDTAADGEEFFRAVATGGVFRAQRLAATRDRIGYFDGEQRRHRFLDQLENHVARRLPSRDLGLRPGRPSS